MIILSLLLASAIASSTSVHAESVLEPVLIARATKANPDVTDRQEAIVIPHFVDNGFSFQIGSIENLRTYVKFSYIGATGGILIPF